MNKVVMTSVVALFISVAAQADWGDRGGGGRGPGSGRGNWNQGPGPHAPAQPVNPNWRNGPGPGGPRNWGTPGRQGPGWGHPGNPGFNRRWDRPHNWSWRNYNAPGWWGRRSWAPPAFYWGPSVYRGQWQCIAFDESGDRYFGTDWNDVEDAAYEAKNECMRKNDWFEDDSDCYIPPGYCDRY
ncbi:hypothetical protein K2X30_12870 [bacterium]|nr:hypothetical protein [bacterium]